VRLCAFDLDHTLVRTPLDLAAMAADMRACLEGAGARLPARDERYRVGELLRWCKREMPALESALWTLALDREQQAMDRATLEAGALAAVTGARRLGFVTALWTNNAGAVTRGALERLGLAEHFEIVVTRDEMRELKPDPDGWRVIAGSVNGAAHGPHGAVHSPHGAAHGPHYMVGDSWVDGLAATAAGVPFIAYRMTPADLARWKIDPVTTLTDLQALPDFLASR
jgi:phosphoglycolate phosphatase-like HAD superfamily hydrolase